MYLDIIENVLKKKPLVHNITNYVTVNDCANVVLASGASPIMADDINEVCEISSICKALVINIGTLNERTFKSMVKSAKMANKINIPVILDPVGVGASSFRTKCVNELIKNVKFDVIKGNISEIKSINNGIGQTGGVDASDYDAIDDDSVESAIDIAKTLSKKTGAVIAMTSKIDIVANSDHANIIRNGHQYMSKITGTGCMLGALIGSYCAANDDYLTATTVAIGMFGVCGEFAYDYINDNNLGTMSFKVALIDNLSRLSKDDLIGGMKIESK